VHEVDLLVQALDLRLQVALVDSHTEEVDSHAEQVDSHTEEVDSHTEEVDAYTEEVDLHLLLLELLRRRHLHLTQPPPLHLRLQHNKFNTPTYIIKKRSCVEGVGKIRVNGLGVVGVRRIQV